VTDGVTLRRADAGDGDALGDVWLSAWYATFDFPPGHPDPDVRRWLKDEMLPAHEVWVAVTPADGVIGFMALSDAMVDQLYIAPAWIGRGVGSALLDLAKARRPEGLDLYCFQANGRARRFYEARGFRVIATGDGSNNEEGQPDLRYAWRP
jgi:ribosomal protein S18 acetylase RimI-like enzyme